MVYKSNRGSTFAFIIDLNLAGLVTAYKNPSLVRFIFWSPFTINSVWPETFNFSAIGLVASSSRFKALKVT